MNFFGRKKTEPNGGNSEPTLRPLRPRDVPAVCNIIAEHDEDDAAEAHDDFTNGRGHNFVYASGNEILGCCGYVLAEDTLGTAWLGWTYVAEAHQRRGYGTAMLIALRNHLEGADIRRLYLDTSDYKEDGVDIYAGARNFYEKHLQARREIVIHDYYQPGESKYIYSLPVLDYGTDDPRFAEYDEPDGYVEFRDIFTAAETENGCVVGWAVTEMPGDQLGDLARLIDRARKADGHLMTLSLPSGLAQRHSHILSGAGLTFLGQVQDYYAPGVHDDYWGTPLQDETEEAEAFG